MRKGRSDPVCRQDHHNRQRDPENPQGHLPTKVPRQESKPESNRHHRRGNRIERLQRRLARRPKSINNMKPPERRMYNLLPGPIRQLTILTMRPVRGTRHRPDPLPDRTVADMVAGDAPREHRADNKISENPILVVTEVRFRATVHPRGMESRPLKDAMVRVPALTVAVTRVTDLRPGPRVRGLLAVLGAEGPDPTS